MTASGDLDRRYGGGDSQKSEIHGFGNCLTGQNYENSGISRTVLNSSAVTQVAFVPFSNRRAKCRCLRYFCFCGRKESPLLVRSLRGRFSRCRGGTFRAISVRSCRVRKENDSDTNPVFVTTALPWVVAETFDYGSFLSAFLLSFAWSTNSVSPGIYMLKEKTIVPMKIAMKRIVIRILLLLSD